MMSVTPMHAVNLLCYNNLALTQDALASVFAQDVGKLRVLVVNNGSTDGTREWLDSLPRETDRYVLQVQHEPRNRNCSELSNASLTHLFNLGHEWVLAVANDTVLPPNLYREFLRWPRGFVTGTAAADKPPKAVEGSVALSERTPMSVMLVRKWAWQALIAQEGHFLDEGYFMYASDCDLAVRMSMCGVWGVKLSTTYWHYGSSTWKLAPEDERKAMLRQADVDRAYFERKWGYKVSDPQYAANARNINFRGKEGK